MSDQCEYLLTADSDAASSNVTVWRAETAARVSSTRGAAMATGSASLLANATLLAGERDRPALGVWPLSSADQSQRRHPVGGVVTAVAADPSGAWLAVALAERLALYHALSGRQVALVSRHYQPVTCLCFSDDGAALVSAGADALAAAWLLVALADCERPPAPEPLHVWADHALPVQGVCISGGGVGRARVFTVSLDGSCRVYQLASGRQLLAVSGLADSCSLTAVAVCAAEQWLLVGAAGGLIHRLSLREPPRCMTASGAEGALQLSGHTAPVRSLSVASTAPLVASASDDGTVRVWQLLTGLCCHSLPVRATPVTLMFFTAPPSLLAPGGTAPPLSLAPLQRQLAPASEPLDLHVQLVDQSSCDSEEQCPGEESRQLSRKLARAHAINCSMYSFMVDTLSSGLLSGDKQ